MIASGAAGGPGTARGWGRCAPRQGIVALAGIAACAVGLSLCARGALAETAAAPREPAPDYEGSVAELVPGPRPIGPGWSLSTDALIEDTDRPPAVPGGGGGADMARWALEYTQSQFRKERVRAAGNFTYEATGAGERAMCDVRILLFRTRADLDESWRRKFGGVAEAMTPADLGEEGIVAGSSERTTFRRANVWVSVMAIGEAVACLPVVHALDARIAEKTGGTARARGPRQDQLTCRALLSGTAPPATAEQLPALAALLVAGDADCRREAVRRIARVGGDRALAVLAGIVADSMSREVVEAVKGLCAIGGAAAEAAIARGFDRGGSAAVPEFLSALRECGGPLQLDILRAGLSHRLKEVRREVARELGDLEDAGSVEPLIASLDDPEMYGSGMALAKIGPPAIAPLIERCRVRGGPKHSPLWCDAIHPLREMGSPARDAMVASLEDPAPQVRLMAAEVLGVIKDRTAAEALARRLGDPEREVRWVAARSLGEIRSQRAVEALWSYLNGEERSVAHQVVASLTCQGRAAVPLLLQSLRHPREAVRLDALKVLAGLDTSVAEAVPLAEALLRDPSVEVRAEAAPLLWKHQAFGSLPALGEAVREEILAGSVGLHSSALRSAIAKFRNAALPHARPLLRDPSPAVRDAALGMLWEMDGQEALEELYRLVKDPDRQVADKARRVRDKVLKRREAVALLQDRDPTKQRDAVQQLLWAYRDEIPIHSCARGVLSGERKTEIFWPVADRETLEALLATMDHGDAWARKSAAKLLVSAGDGHLRRLAIEKLNRMVVSEGREGRIAAAEVLGEAQDPSSVEPLLAMLRDPKKDSVPPARFFAARALVRFGDPDTRETVLEHLLAAPGPLDVQALGSLRDPRAVAPLLDRLERDDLRESSGDRYLMDLLAQSDDPRVLPALMRRVARYPTSTRGDNSELFQALETLTGKRFVNGKNWARWWEREHGR